MPVHQVLSVDQAGDIGGDGISRFAFHTIGGTPASQGVLDGAAVYLHQLYVSLATLVPGSITYAIQPEVPVIDDDSGKITGFGSLTAGLAPITGGGGTGAYAAGAGVRVTLHTGTIKNGRVIRGAFFLVPLSNSAYGPTGGLSSTPQGVIASAVNTYISNMRGAPHPAVVYSRPAKGAVTGGVAAEVLNGVVPGQPTGLRSRRL